MMYESERGFEKAERFAGPARKAVTAARRERLGSTGVTGKLAQFITRRFFRTGGFGMNELLGIAAALIIAAFVVIPGLKGLAESLISKLMGWWEMITGEIFTATP